MANASSTTGQSATGQPVARPSGISHVRLTVTDIARSRAFYAQLLGVEPRIDESAHAGEPGVGDDPQRFYGGCVFALGDQLLGLRPVAPAGDRFDSTRVGLDHVSLAVGSLDELHEAARRLDAAGVARGQVQELAGAGMAILSLQDPDDINLELAAPVPQG